MSSLSASSAAQGSERVELVLLLGVFVSFDSLGHA